MGGEQVTTLRDRLRAIGISMGRDGLPRFLGFPLPVWVLVAGVSIATIIGALVILPRLGRTVAESPAAATTPGESDGVGVVGVATGQPSTPQSTTGTEQGTATAAPPTAEPSAEAAPLELVAFNSVNEVLRWRLHIQIHNPASVPQPWRSVSVQVDQGLSLVLSALTPGTRVYDAGRIVCVEPIGPATIDPGGDAVIEFTINAVLTNAPRRAQLDNPACVSADA